MKKKRKKRTSYSKYTRIPFWEKFFRLLFWITKDIHDIRKNGRRFNEFGVSLYAGKQGAGKTMAMTEYLERMRALYPECIIVTNYGYKHELKPFTDWSDFFKIRNDEKGVIFAIDELQNEFTSTAWKNFPESLLSEITQQRKQKIKIVATSQVFTRVAKPLREQTFEVVECYTFLGRWTFCKAFDAQEYEAVISMPNLKNKLHRLWRRNFIQDNKIREMYDSYAKIERMEKSEFHNRYKAN
jgi:ATP-dependent Clp protease ATP-binding subunit ClpX